MRGNIIVFRFPKEVSHVRVNEFCRKFYGYTDRSNSGRYNYKRAGLIDSVPNVKVIRGVVVVTLADTKKVVDFIEKYGGEVYVWTVTSIVEPLSKK